MAALVHFFGISPAEYWDMNRDDVEALVRYRDKWYKARNK